MLWSCLYAFNALFMLSITHKMLKNPPFFCHSVGILRGYLTSKLSERFDITPTILLFYFKNLLFYSLLKSAITQFQHVHARRKFSQINAHIPRSIGFPSGYLSANGISQRQLPFKSDTITDRN